MLALVALLTRQARRAVPHRNRYANACAPQYFIKSPLERNASRTAAGPVRAPCPSRSLCRVTASALALCCFVIVNLNCGDVHASVHVLADAFLAFLPVLFPPLLCPLRLMGAPVHMTLSGACLGASIIVYRVSHVRMFACRISYTAPRTSAQHGRDADRSTPSLSCRCVSSYLP